MQGCVPRLRRTQGLGAPAPRKACDSRRGVRVTALSSSLGGAMSAVKDAYALLELPEAETNRKVIKTQYRRMALR